MPNSNLVVFYVEDAPRSRQFYETLLQRPPLEHTANFSMFALDSGLKLGPWDRTKVEPAATHPGSSFELFFAVPGNNDVDNMLAAWKAGGLAIAQEPVMMDFGYTFVATDPDGHRLRVFSPAEEAGQ